MERINVSDAQRDFAALVNRVYQQGVSVDVERDTQVIARLSPVRPPATLKVRDLPMLLARLPTISRMGVNTSTFNTGTFRQLPLLGDCRDAILTHMASDHGQLASAVTIVINEAAETWMSRIAPTGRSGGVGNSN